MNEVSTLDSVRTAAEQGHRVVGISFFIEGDILREICKQRAAYHLKKEKHWRQKLEEVRTAELKHISDTNKAFEESEEDEEMHEVVNTLSNAKYIEADKASQFNALIHDHKRARRRFSAWSAFLHPTVIYQLTESELSKFEVLDVELPMDILARCNTPLNVGSTSDAVEREVPQPVKE